MKKLFYIIKFIIIKLFKFLIIFPSQMYNNPDKYDFEKIKDKLNKY